MGQEFRHPESVTKFLHKGLPTRGMAGC